MMSENESKKDLEEIDEVKDEIDSALKDSRGLVAHKKRLAFCLSTGVADILEKYLKRKGVLKQGHKISHQWLKKNKEGVKAIISQKITSSVDSLTELDKILEVAYDIESKRNDLAYGKTASESLLKDSIDKYLELKKEVGNEK